MYNSREKNPLMFDRVLVIVQDQKLYTVINNSQYTMVNW